MDILRIHIYSLQLKMKCDRQLKNKRDKSETPYHTIPINTVIKQIKILSKPKKITIQSKLYTDSN